LKIERSSTGGAEIRKGKMGEGGGIGKNKRQSSESYSERKKEGGAEGAKKGNRPYAPVLKKEMNQGEKNRKKKVGDRTGGDKFQRNTGKEDGLKGKKNGPLTIHGEGRWGGSREEKKENHLTRKRKKPGGDDEGGAGKVKCHVTSSTKRGQKTKERQEGTIMRPDENVFGETGESPTLNTKKKSHRTGLGGGGGAQKKEKSHI